MSHVIQWAKESPVVGRFSTLLLHRFVNCPFGSRTHQALTFGLQCMCFRLVLSACLPRDLVPSKIRLQFAILGGFGAWRDFSIGAYGFLVFCLKISKYRSTSLNPILCVFNRIWRFNGVGKLGGLLSCSVYLHIRRVTPLTFTMKTSINVKWCSVQQTIVSG